LGLSWEWKNYWRHRVVVGEAFIFLAPEAPVENSAAVKNLGAAQ